MTEAEHYQIAKAVELVDLVSSRAKRVAGTVNDFVEKFIHHPDDGGKMWAMTVANMDVSAVDLFTDLWLLDTFENRRENKRAGEGNIQVTPTVVLDTLVSHPEITHVHMVHHETTAGG